MINDRLQKRLTTQVTIHNFLREKVIKKQRAQILTILLIHKPNIITYMFFCIKIYMSQYGIFLRGKVIKMQKITNINHLINKLIQYYYGFHTISSNFGKLIGSII